MSHSEPGIKDLPAEPMQELAMPPQLSRLNDRFSELVTAAPLTGLFKSFIDPVVVVAVLYGLAWPFQVSFDSYSWLLAVLTFLLTSQVLDGVFLFVPGHERPLLGLGRFAVQWLFICTVLCLIGWATRFAAYFYPPYILTWFAVAPLALVAVHALFRPVLLASRESTQGTRSAVIVGANRPGCTLAEALINDPLHRIEFKGYFDDRELPRLPGVSADALLGTLKELPAYVRRNGIHHIYISLPMSSQPRVMQVLDALHDSTASIYFVPDLFVFDLIQARFDHVAGIPVVTICESPFIGLRGVLKRFSDVVLATVILALIWPAMLIVAAAVKLTSKGPVLFKQRRYGADGESILVYKFRSMTVMEDGDKVVQATKNDQRLTPIGGLIRKTSIDELPQFINVLQGRMSIVGPRPHANAHNEQYRALIKGYMMRHKVKPGITGWAQVNGFRGETDTLDKMQRRIEYDLDYLRNWSIWLDLKIVGKTISMMVVRDKNAY
ncbi:putative colanic acid biosysnthesis UDP-glucose lipid carrier transferase [Andreprevotia lacus DSM 23236]|jgi:putative colanic acid biosynthesis UDP-glucose lipid carrier transferase|uniref:Putative colanic acid biosysnthesis UDP-glucose lipid carrier transferase n=1 Tax=Andreprevotia lacus DSM 23236 TaxID=1121001 RepID=A0A1W1XGQ2_9NEIS|nr:undecaprenyl-phosphate glucose phosphotransferase [Andreprevotia lacus]SMC23007.1 putative colanic acid biosysnthesis UDP-glucose lipid carrier transferase [Andreprevotia lacus DSM 23236]